MLIPFSALSTGNKVLIIGVIVVVVLPMLALMIRALVKGKVRMGGIGMPPSPGNVGPVQGIGTGIPTDIGGPT